MANDVAEIATDFETRSKLIKQKQTERKQLASGMVEEAFGSMAKLINMSKEVGDLEPDVVPEGVKQEFAKLAKELDKVHITITQIYGRINGNVSTEA